MAAYLQDMAKQLRSNEKTRKAKTEAGEILTAKMGKLQASVAKSADEMMNSPHAMQLQLQEGRTGLDQHPKSLWTVACW